MQKVFCFESLFLFQLYSPLDISLFFFKKTKQNKTKQKNLKNPYPFEVCSCVLNFIVIGQYTINIPEKFQALMTFPVWQQNYWQLRLWGTDDGICIGNSMICSGIWHKYHEWYFKIVIRNFTSRWASEIWDNFEISQVVFMPNITYKSCCYLFMLLPEKGL